MNVGEVGEKAHMESTDDDVDDVQQEIRDEKSENMENNCWRFIYFLLLSKVRLARSATWDRYTNLLSNTIA